MATAPPKRDRCDAPTLIDTDDLGHEFGNNAAVVEAIELYRNEALPRTPRERVPLDWAVTQNNLGNALGALGLRSL